MKSTFHRKQTSRLRRYNNSYSSLKVLWSLDYSIVAVNIICPEGYTISIDVNLFVDSYSFKTLGLVDIKNEILTINTPTQHGCCMTLRTVDIDGTRKNFGPSSHIIPHLFFLCSFTSHTIDTRTYWLCFPSTTIATGTRSWENHSHPNCKR